MYSVGRFIIFYPAIAGQQFLIPHTVLLGFVLLLECLSFLLFTLVFEFDLRVDVSHRWAKLCKKPKIRGHPWKESLCQSLISLMCLKLFVTNPGKSELFHHLSALLLPWFLEQFTQVIISKEIKRHYRITFSLSATIMKLLLSTFLHFCTQ